MPEHFANEDVAFMLRRTAAILLADERRSESFSIAATVSPYALSSAEQTVVPWTPLLLAANISRMWPSFRHAVLEPFANATKRAIGFSALARPKHVDWNRTACSLLSDTEQVFIRADAAAREFDESRVLIFLVAEVRIHLHELCTELDTHALSSPGIVTLREQLQEMRHELLLCWERRSCQELLEKTCEQFPLDSISGAFCELLLSARSCTKDAYERYLKVSAEAVGLASYSQHSHDASCLWRDTYLSLATGLGPGRDLIVKGTTDVAHLYELWCFMEIANHLAARSALCVIQERPIRAGKDQLLFWSDVLGKVYYNFGGRTIGRSLPRGASKILQDSCVEWFFVLPDGRRAVLDTKFKAWSSRDNLSVLGYMADFSAQVGIVVFAQELRREAYAHPEVLKDDLVAVRVDGVTDGLFVACSLQPRPEFQLRNATVLSAICDILSKEPQC